VGEKQALCRSVVVLPLYIGTLYHKAGWVASDSFSCILR
jgi:hypothetical protein